LLQLDPKCHRPEIELLVSTWTSEMRKGCSENLNNIYLRVLLIIETMAYPLVCRCMLEIILIAVTVKTI
jgi:hypothetical protein